MYLTQKQRRYLGSRGKEQPLAEQRPKHSFLTLFNQSGRSARDRHDALWHVVPAAGLLSQRMIISAPASWKQH